MSGACPDRGTMRICLLPTLLPLLFLASDSLTWAGPDESQEPPLQFSVHVGDKSLMVAEGETGQLEGTFAHPRIKVVPQPYRVFPYQGITFEYPRSFTFEADLTDPGVKNWNLSGNDFQIMIFVMDTQLTARAFANNMIEQFGRENCVLVDTNSKITLGDKTLSGATLHITLAAHKMVMDVYRVPSQDSRTKLLVLRDNLDEEDQRSKEGKATLLKMKSSFQLRP